MPTTVTSVVAGARHKNKKIYRKNELAHDSKTNHMLSKNPNPCAMMLPKLTHIRNREYPIKIPTTSTIMLINAKYNNQLKTYSFVS